VFSTVARSGVVVQHRGDGRGEDDEDDEDDESRGAEREGKRACGYILSNTAVRQVLSIANSLLAYLFWGHAGSFFGIFLIW
jgi:hypothetical protein